MLAAPGPPRAAIMTFGGRKKKWTLKFLSSERLRCLAGVKSQTNDGGSAASVFQTNFHTVCVCVFALRQGDVIKVAMAI